MDGQIVIWLLVLLGMIAIITIFAFYIKDEEEEIAQEIVRNVWGAKKLDTWHIKLNTRKKWIRGVFYFRYLLVAVFLHSAIMLVDFALPYNSDLEKTIETDEAPQGQLSCYKSASHSFALATPALVPNERIIIESSWFWGIPMQVKKESDRYRKVYPTQKRLHDFIWLPILMFLVSGTALFMRRGLYHWLYGGVCVAIGLECLYFGLASFYCV